jgi:hypothetical protein
LDKLSQLRTRAHSETSEKYIEPGYLTDGAPTNQ